MTSREDAHAFISDFQMLLNSGTRLILIPRRENIDSMQYFGFNERAVTQEILQLTFENYSGGPLRDRDRPGHVWIFGYELFKEPMYVKLKIGQEMSKEGRRIKKPICISWHIAERPLMLPYAGDI